MEHANHSAALFLPWGFGLLAVSFVVSALALLWRDRIGAATLSGALFFLCVVLGYFPQLDSITALSIQVKLGRQIDQAKDLLRQLRLLSRATAAFSYHSLASEGRFIDENFAKEKEMAAASIINEMTVLGISDADQIEIAAPLMGTIAGDLLNVFDQTLMGALQKNSSEQHAVQISTEVLTDVPDVNRLETLRGTNLQHLFELKIQKFPPDPRDAAALRNLGTKLASLLDDCRSAHNYTDETANLLDDYLSLGQPGQYYAKLDRFR